jgi:MFS family permease
MGFFSNQALVEGERKQKLNAYNVLVLLMLAPTSITYGYSASIISTTLGQPSFLEYFNLLTAPNATSILGATGGLFFAGATIGPLLLPWIADKYGRKWSIVLSLVISLIAFAVEAGSTHIAEFLAFRFVAGAGSFMMLAAVPVSDIVFSVPLQTKSADKIS